MALSRSDSLVNLGWNKVAPAEADIEDQRVALSRSDSLVNLVRNKVAPAKADIEDQRGEEDGAE